MSGLPVTIRLLDPPLHEFLPHTEEELAGGRDLARRWSAEKLKRRAGELHESNPMLGLRGCRLGIAYPEITEMQARAIFEAAVEVAGDRHAGRAGDHGAARDDAAELDLVKERIVAMAEAVAKETKQRASTIWSAR